MTSARNARRQEQMDWMIEVTMNHLNSFDVYPAIFGVFYQFTPFMPITWDHQPTWFRASVPLPFCIWSTKLSYLGRSICRTSPGQGFKKKVSISSNIIVIITVIIIVIIIIIIIVIIIIIIIIIIIKSYRNKVMIGPKMPHFPGVISVRHFLIGMMACMWQLPSQVHLILDPNEGNQQTESLFKWQFLDRIYAHLWRFKS